MNKLLIFTIIFLLQSFSSFGKWVKYENHYVGNTYIEEDTISKRGDLVYVNLLGKASGDNLLASMTPAIRKNGSEYAASTTQFYTNYEKQHTIMISHIIDMNGSSDYVEFYGYVNITSGSATFSTDSVKATNFGAYRIGA